MPIVSKWATLLQMEILQFLAIDRDDREMIFYHNGSQIKNFEGTVTVDARSNR